VSVDTALTVFCSFGWVNASYVYGLTLINAHMKRAMGALTTWDTYVKATQDLGIEDAF